MEFKTFRINGFKSFADPVEIEIFPGLTGIVGPNGCGKSNLVESLRWMMGEASSKSMRGSHMEDVIFAGTSLRPPNEIAEVSVVLKNNHHDAPAPHQDKDIIEISRHIERNAGSHYQINGDEARARDVNMFFSDLLGGSHSSALVSQGRIDQIILAKPKERRRILEEAAGITGLHARRHEADLRLRHAGDNLKKLADNIKQTESRLRQLKKQATQAERYRKTSEEIERMEALRLWTRWHNAQNDLALEEQKLIQTQNKADELAETSARVQKIEAEAESELDNVRKKTAETASAVERLENEKALLEREIHDAEEKIAALIRTQKELQEDTARVKEMTADGQAQITGFDEEEQGIAQDAAGHQQAAQAAEEKTRACQEALTQAEAEAEIATKKRADWNGTILSLEQRLQEAQKHDARISAEQDDILNQLQEFSGFDDDHEETAALKNQSDAAHRAMRDCESKIHEAEKTRAQAERNERKAHDHLSEARTIASQCEAETSAMSKLFADIGNHPGKAVIDLIKGGWFGQRHLDMAMAAALGDDLMASLEEGSASFWRSGSKSEKRNFFFRRRAAHEDDPPLPKGAVPMSKYIRKPYVLHRRLAQTGIVDAERGAELQKELKPGQRLVSREGCLWRWDGYSADARIAHATQNRLAQWRTFSALEAKAEKARQTQNAAEKYLHDARHQLDISSQNLDGAKASHLKMRQEAEQARDQWQKAAAEISEKMARKAALDEAARRLAEENTAAIKQIEETQIRLNSIKENQSPQQQEEQARTTALEARNALSAAKEAQTEIAQNITKRRHRLDQIAQSRQSVEKNLAHCVQQMNAIAARQKAAQEDMDKIKNKPQTIAIKIEAINGHLAEAEKNRSAAQKISAEAETLYNQRRKEARAIEKNLAHWRESLARQKAVQENAGQRLADCHAEIDNKYDRPPEAIPAWAELEDDSAMPSMEEIEETLARLDSERTRIGAPNLQAEEEREGMIDDYEKMKSEADDLEKAINRLRRGISTLNREGRERLLEAFEKVNAHFKSLFKKLFGGGQARLTLSGDDDPLEAGLEIIARPPGKAVGNMSLLSGGEKALTAISLLFAAFKTRPAPICVLDEVDAPLDERNVQHFCDLLDDMSSSHQTRFLIITHHAITLSRMDRLYGVTMEEEGVSRIVSVELEQAEDMREPLQATG